MKPVAIDAWEAELLRALDVHDAFVAACAGGSLSLTDFLRVYDGFYARYPLDGHESNAQELQALQKHAERIALHREVWDEVITKVTSAAFDAQTIAAAGLIGPDEADLRVRNLARRHLRGHVPYSSWM